KRYGNCSFAGIDKCVIASSESNNMTRNQEELPCEQKGMLSGRNGLRVSLDWMIPMLNTLKEEHD
ncbi:MAG: hypothetical protein KAJ96_03910, partial [Candidatus Thorarchaeota archaeon]|nr:hypothetical protein [Candidatus Thorarchaeota archaeon]